MPGLFGIISNRAKEINEQELCSMHNSVVNENFYNSGTYVCSDLGIYVGWTTLKGSFSDCMPVTNEKKDIVLIYSGENFKDISEINDLKGRNHQFNKRNATYLVHMYEEWKEKFLLMLNGRFQGLLIDLREKKYFIFNDRFGLQKFYFHQNKQAFYFSIEAKAILAVLPETREINIHSLGEIYSFNCIGENKSIFKDISIMPSGSYWVFCTENRIVKYRFFTGSEFDKEPYLEKEYHQEKFKYTLRKILSRYFKADDKLGIKITKDLETIAILAHAMYSPEKLPCLAVSYKRHPFLDLEAMISKKISEVTGQKFHLIDINDGFFDQFYTLAQKSVIISCGNIGVAGAIDLYMYMKAREISTALVLGSKATGILRNEPLISKNKIKMSLFSGDFKIIMDQIKNNENKKFLDTLTLKVLKGVSLYSGGNISLGQSQMEIRTPLLDNDLIELMYRVPEEKGINQELVLRLADDAERNLLRKINFGNNTTDRILYRIKRYHALFAIISKWKCSGRSINDNVGVWYRNELSNYVQDILCDKRSLERPHINKISVKAAVDKHIKGEEDYTNEITTLLNTELIYRGFIDTLY